MKNQENIVVGISIGDLNGIGGEIILKTFDDARILEFCTPVIFASVKVMNFFKKHFESSIDFHGLHDKNPRNVASALRINPYFVNEYVSAARNFPMRKVSQIVATLREFDVRGKGVNSNAVPQGDLLRELLVRIFA